MSTPVYNQLPNVGNRPYGLKDAQGNLIVDSFEWMAFQGQYSGTNLIYKGFARPGSSQSAAVWQISMQTYDASNNLLSVTWPENTLGVASNDFQFVWANRASYTYA
jgi:hypothetical protein